MPRPRFRSVVPDAYRGAWSCELRCTPRSHQKLDARTARCARTRVARRRRGLVLTGAHAHAHSRAFARAPRRRRRVAARTATERLTAGCDTFVNSATRT